MPEESPEWNIRHVDDLLAFSTAKIVVIRDRRLGCLYCFITIVIILYIFVFQILYLNKHYPVKDVIGTARVSIQQPTKSDCDPDNRGCESDFLSLEQLPYCREFIGTQTLLSTYREPCVFADKHSMAPDGTLTSHLLVPTMVESTVETKGCEPSAANGHKCKNEYEVSGEKTTVFVADIEHYTVLVSHTYTQVAESGTSSEVQGYYLECDRSGDELSATDPQRFMYGEKGIPCPGKTSKRPIDCIRSDCPYLMGPGSFNFKRFTGQLKEIGSLLATQAADVFRPRSATKGTERSHEHHRHHRRHGHRQHHLMRNEYVVGADGHVHPDARPEDDRGLAQQGEKKIGGLGNSSQLEGVAAIQSQEEGARELVEAPNEAEIRETGAWAVKDGDVFTVQKLLELCDLSLDETKNTEGKTLREAGTVIEIEALYTNLHPWTSSFGNTDIEYEYKVTRRPVESLTNEVYSQYQPHFPAQRALDHRHGLYIIVKIGGKFGEFSPIYTLIMICTAMSLLRLATYFVDFIAMYCMKRKDVYFDAKYERTDRVWGMQKGAPASEAAAAISNPGGSEGGGAGLAAQTESAASG